MRGSAFLVVFCFVVPSPRVSYTHLGRIDLLEVLHDAEDTFSDLLLVEERAACFGREAAFGCEAPRRCRLQLHVSEHGRSEGGKCTRHRHRGPVRALRDVVVARERALVHFDRKAWAIPTRPSPGSKGSGCRDRPGGHVPSIGSLLRV